MQRLHQEVVPQISEQLQAKAWAAAKTMTGLVLGVDDFAIKKGHTYNTGIHNHRGETMLDLLPGRKLEDLRSYAAAHQTSVICAPRQS
ncbi:transposase [Paenibacillus sp. SYP-B3998]|uniref:Transposase n=1 Tax=Paenibacillus sp. SYP-B3998 TaxID=2678564 RepID=A0A6G4A5T5_9BACL|nr:transposase [Paenibacillus sp. SYP-B3998]